MIFKRSKKDKFERDLVRYAVDYPFRPEFAVNLVRTDEHNADGITILYRSTITYGDSSHDVALKRNPDGRLTWYVAPYNGAFFETDAAIPESFTVAVQAILDHTDVHRRHPKPQHQ